MEEGDEGIFCSIKSAINFLHHPSLFFFPQFVRLLDLLFTNNSLLWPRRHAYAPSCWPTAHLLCPGRTLVRRPRRATWGRRFRRRSAGAHRPLRPVGQRRRYQAGQVAVLLLHRADQAGRVFLLHSFLRKYIFTSRCSVWKIWLDFLPLLDILLGGCLLDIVFCWGRWWYLDLIDIATASKH